MKSKKVTLVSLLPLASTFDYQAFSIASVFSLAIFSMIRNHFVSNPDAIGSMAVGGLLGLFITVFRAGIRVSCALNSAEKAALVQRLKSFRYIKSARQDTDKEREIYFRDVHRLFRWDAENIVITKLNHDEYKVVFPWKLRRTILNAS